LPREAATKWLGRLALGLAAIAYAMAVVVVASRAPDKGFLAFRDARVVHVTRGSEADGAGIEPGDAITSVDGRPTTVTADYVDALLTRSPGERVRLGVAKPDGRRLAAEITLREPALPWSSIAALVMGAFLVAMGLLAVRSRPKDVAAERFFRITVVYALVYAGGLSWTELLVHPFLLAIGLVGLYAAPPLGLEFALAFPVATEQRHGRLRIAAWGLSGVFFLVAAISALRASSDDAVLVWTVRAITAQLVLILVTHAIGLSVQWSAVRRADRLTGGERTKLKWWTYGLGLSNSVPLAAAPFAAANLEAFLVEGYEPFAAIMAVTFFAASSIAVLAEKLVDVDALISRSVAYAVSTGAAIAVFVLVAFLAGAIVEGAVGGAGLVGNLVAAVVAAGLFGPIHARVRALIDRRFMRDRRHYVEALEGLSQAVLALREPVELAREVVDGTVRALAASGGALFLRGGEGRAWVAAASTGDMGDLRDADAVPPEGIAVDVPTAADASAHARLVLGPRLGGDVYTRRDRALLGALAAELGIALENARAYATIADMTRTLESQNQEIRSLRDKLEDENRYLKGRLSAQAGDERRLVGSSKAMRELRAQIERVAASEAIVLLLGETGTGKSLVARAVHDASARADGPFIHLDCGAIPKGVFESELFGHERGAFTGAVRNRRGAFELADGGTLFLDEVGELPLDMQPKLLRVLAEQSFTRVGGTEPVRVDVRVVAATNRDLGTMAQKGAFREDLYYRLAVVELDVPPLRARRSDVREIAESMLLGLCRRNHVDQKKLADDAVLRMNAYGWPGNVRELRNVLERAVVLSDGGHITGEDLALPDAPPSGEELAEAARALADEPHRDVMETLERDRLVAALRAAGGNRSSAARSLGIPRTTLLHKMRRYGL
jgi:Nif-specific regulatory protein